MVAMVLQFTAIERLLLSFMVVFFDDESFTTNELSSGIKKAEKLDRDCIDDFSRLLFSLVLKYVVLSNICISSM